MQNELITFRNANFTKRNYECTNVVCCQAPSIQDAKEASPNANWIECGAEEVAKLQALWRQGSVKFFGWL